MKNIFYVYLHTRLDNGTVFYVGKGHNDRAWSKWSRNRRWTFISEKHGWIASIVQDGMSESDANLLEMWLISKLRYEGVDLCNVTDGGDGRSGPCLELRKPVVCSNGMKFNSVNEAAIWAGVSASKISSVINGRRLSSAGFAWWFEGDTPKEYLDPNVRTSIARSKGIYRSDGVYFDSISKAAIESGGFPANIIKCAKGVIQSAYGYSWAYDFIPDSPRKMTDIYTEKLGIPIQCVETNTIHPSAERAAEWVKTVGSIKATGTPISLVAKGKAKSAYGYTWSYLK